MGHLTDFLNFQPFNELRKQMGADQLGSFSFEISTETVSSEEEKALSTGGLEIESEEIEQFEDGTLRYKNRKSSFTSEIFLLLPVGLNSTSHGVKHCKE